MKEAFLQIHNLVTQEEGSGLDRFHLRMSRGDFVEILGAEGAGKRDVASFFAGEDPIVSGYVKIGEDIYLPGETVSDAGIHYMGPVPGLAESLTVAENVVLLTKRRKVRGIIRHRDLSARVNFLLSEFGLTVKAEQKVHELSEGEKRCVELLRAVENEAQLVFMDRVFDALGQKETELLEGCLAAMKRREMTILVLGGGFPVLRELDDRIVVLRGGQAVRTFYRGNFDREEYVKWVFGVKVPANLRADAVMRSAKWETDGNSLNKGEEILRLSSVSGEGLSDLSLSVARGEIVGIYDMDNRRNKILVRMLTGKEKVVSGQMTLKGKPFRPSSLTEALHRGIAFIPTTVFDNAVIEGMSCGENLALSTLREHSYLGIVPKKRVLDFLAREFSEADGDFPGGDALQAVSGRASENYRKMRMVLHRILLRRPDLLLMEDLVSDMNVHLLKLQNDYFSRLVKKGCAVIISSQNLTVLRQLCDRIIVMTE